MRNVAMYCMCKMHEHMYKTKQPAICMEIHAWVYESSWKFIWQIREIDKETLPCRKMYCQSSWGMSKPGSHWIPGALPPNIGGIPRNGPWCHDQAKKLFKNAFLPAILRVTRSSALAALCKSVLKLLNIRNINNQKGIPGLSFLPHLTSSSWGYGESSPLDQRLWTAWVHHSHPRAHNWQVEETTLETVTFLGSWKNLRWKALL